MSPNMVGISQFHNNMTMPQSAAAIAKKRSGIKNLNFFILLIEFVFDYLCFLRALYVGRQMRLKNILQEGKKKREQM